MATNKTTINEHLFHGIYSNGYQKSEVSTDIRTAEKPIHYFRASFAEKENPTDTRPKEFESEEQALKWYKKNKYGEETYNELEFPKDFCKNYFIISESEFHKYKGLFHGMIKGIKITSDIEIQSEGNAFSPDCPICKRDFKIGIDIGAVAGPIVFNSPNGKPSYFTATGGADDDGFLNGKKITSITAGPFDQSLIPKTKETTLSFTAVDTVGANVGIEATVTWYKEIEYKQKIKFSSNFESTKIFDIKDLEKRLGATNLKYNTAIDLKEDKNKEELISEYRKIFKDEWEFDSAEFKSIFETSSNKFNENATFLNDPVLIPKYIDKSPLEIENTHVFPDPEKNIDILTSEIVDKQKNFSKKFEKFGSIEYKVENENSVINYSTQYLYFAISKLLYIRKEKKYLCFVELVNTIPLNGSAIDKQKDCPETDCEVISSSSSSSGSPQFIQTEDFIEILTKLNLLDEDADIMFNNNLQSDNINYLSTTDNYFSIGNTNPFNISYIFTTSDLINKEPPKYRSSECDEEEKELEFKKNECEIKLSNQSFKIEIFQLKENEFNFDNSECENLIPGFKKGIKNNLKINSVKPPIFEILEWQKTDFSKTNKFPDKIR